MRGLRPDMGGKSTLKLPLEGGTHEVEWPFQGATLNGFGVRVISSDEWEPDWSLRSGGG